MHNTTKCGQCKRLAGHEATCPVVAARQCEVCPTGSHHDCTGHPCECRLQHAVRYIAVKTQKVYVVMDGGTEVMRTEDPDVAQRVAGQDTPGGAP